MITLEQSIETQETDKKSEKSNETNEEIDEEINEKIDDNLTFLLIIDLKDSYETMLDDAIKEKMHPSNTDWPNDIYRELLPKNIKKGYKFLDINEFSYMKFKTVPITDMDYHFYYQLIIHDSI